MSVSGESAGGGGDIPGGILLEGGLQLVLIQLDDLEAAGLLVAALILS